MKKVFYILLVVIIIIVTSIFIINKKNNDKDENNDNETNNMMNESREENSNNNVNLKEVDNTAMYFTVESCIKNYMKSISKQDNEAILGILDQNYINDNNIDVNNILEYVTKNNEKKALDFDIQKMLVENDEEDIQKYYVYGVVRNPEGRKEKEYLTINVDINALVYSIIPNVPKGVFDEGK